MPDKINEIAEKIKKYRKIRNMSQDMLAESSGINVSMIKKYECGIRHPKPEQLLKISNALGISINALYSHEINTISDVITLLIKLDEQTSLNISGVKDESGKYIPKSISLSFDDENINEALSKYLTYKDNIASTCTIHRHTNSSQTDAEKNKEYIEFEIEHQITNLITSDTMIKRPGSL